MISLSRHIELLLLDHDCVIVPGLGGFIANLASARYTGYPTDGEGAPADNLFLPPYRSIGFNPQLLLNDGLLVQSYMQVYDASYPEAYLQMEKEIEQVKEQLDLAGEYQLDGIGTLSKSLNNGITLTSTEAGVLTPSLYGTYSFEMQSVAELIAEREKQNILPSGINIAPIQTEADFTQHMEEKAQDKADDAVADQAEQLSAEANDQQASGGNITLRINRRWLDVSIAAAVAAILFLFVSYPTLRNFGEEADTCIAGTPYIAEPTSTTQISTSGANNTTNTKTGGKQSHDGAATDSTSTSDNSNQDTVPSDNKKSVKEYTIVLASYVSVANSKIFIKDLADAGYAEAEYIKDGKVSRIIYSSFASEQEAYTTLASLRGKASAFSDAWIMKLK